MSQLTNYIQKELDKGFSKDLITKKLLQAGYTQEEITDSFKSLKSAEPILRRKFADTLHLETHIQWSKWIFGLLAIAVVMGLGFLIYQYGAELPSYREEPISSCDSFSDEEKDLCYLQLSATGQDYCSQIQNLALKTACDQKIWEADDCTYELFLGEDYDACLFQKAVETKDTKYCTMQEEHSDCLYELAIAAEDPLLCKQDSVCLTTYAYEQQEIGLCEEVIDFFKWQCYDIYAAQTGDLSACSNGSFICGFSTLSTTQEKKTFIEQKLSYFSIEIPPNDDLSPRDESLYVFAQETGDNIFCDYILNYNTQQDCYNREG